VDEDVGPLLGLTVHRSIHVEYQRLNEILVALPSPQLSAGGGTANTIKIASLLGISTAFVGTVGSSPVNHPNGSGENDSSTEISGARHRKIVLPKYSGTIWPKWRFKPT